MLTQRLINTVESHTEGMSTRMVTGGIPPLTGDTMLDRLQTASREHESMRGVLVLEPARTRCDDDRDPAAVDPARRRLGRDLRRGDRLPADVRPRDDRRRDHPGRDQHGEGRRTGHGWSAPTPPPAWSRPWWRSATAGRSVVTLTNVPAFLLEANARSTCPGSGRCPTRWPYGGNFYPIVEAEAVGLDLTLESWNELVERGRKVAAAIDAERPPVHPASPEIRGTRYVQFVGPGADGADSRHRGRHPYRLLRSLPVRHRHLGPDGPAPCSRQTGGRPEIRQRSSDRHSLHRRDRRDRQRLRATPR